MRRGVQILEIAYNPLKIKTLSISEPVVLEKRICRIVDSGIFPRYFAVVRDPLSIKRIGNQKLAGIYSRKKITNANGDRLIDGWYEHVLNFRGCLAV